MRALSLIVLALLLLPMFRACCEPSEYMVDVGGPLDELLVQSGWYGREGPYAQFGPIWRSACRWAQQGAVIRIPVFPGVQNTIEIRAEVRGDAEQRIRCLFGDKLVAELPISGDLHYRFDVPPDALDDTGWALLKLETLAASPVGGDSRDLRAAVDWIKISAEAEARAFWVEAAAGLGMEFLNLYEDEQPTRWRFRYDPNDAGDKFAPQKFNAITYDDSAFELVPIGYAPEMRRGDTAWYRTWLLLSGKNSAIRDALKLPGKGFEEDGRRVVWVNGEQIAAEPGDATFEQQAGRALSNGYNFIVVKLMKGPLPRQSGPAIVAAPKYSCEWTDNGFRFDMETLTLTDEFVSARQIRLTLLDPAGERVGQFAGNVGDLGEGKRGVKPQCQWDVTGFGQHTLVVEADGTSRQEIPLHFLGLHFFHWGWYIAGGGTGWNGFKPCSNDYIDELFEKMDDWERPHHSICWCGGIITPGTGFDRTEKVNYTPRFRQAFEEGWLDFVGMPFAPRNICTDFGESLLRGMRKSQALYRDRFGVQPNRFYSHDATMTPQLPQIMQMTGYDTYCIAENWWGQGRSIPNSRDCYFRNPDGSSVRILDSWYHGVSPVVAARRAAEQGKPAVLCNEEFACLDRTTFLVQDNIDQLASEGIFIKPVTLDQYQQITEKFAREYTYEGDEALCYKGWTGGGEGEVEVEKASRAVETRLVALENLAAFARSLGIEVDQAFLDTWWDRSLRYHECHLHWGNGVKWHGDQLREGLGLIDAEVARVAQLISARTRGDGDAVSVFNLLGHEYSGLVRIPMEQPVVSLTSGDTQLAVQADPGDPGRGLVSVSSLPSCGYRNFTRSDQQAAAPGVTATLQDDAVSLQSDQLQVIVNADGRIASVTDARSGEVLVTDLNVLHMARAQGKAPQEPLSTELKPLNDAHYLEAAGNAAPAVICQGPVMAAIECELAVPDYPDAKLSMRVELVTGERKVRLRLRTEFPEPTVVAPAGAGGPGEGTYFPGIYVDFPMPAEADPVADMAYCVTDGVLTSTNHETFMKQPFRNGTFNALSLAAPNSGQFAVLTRGLPDFFVLRRPEGRLGMSLGIGAANCPYNGTYVHEYALFVPAVENRGRTADQAFMAARSFVVEPVAVTRDAPGDSLPPEASFVSAAGEGVTIAGIQDEGGELTMRVVNLREEPVTAILSGLAKLDGAQIGPTGALAGNALQLGPKAVREIRVERP